MICYQQPQLEEEVVEYVAKDGQIRTRLRRKVSFWGYKEGRWQKLYLYGGLQCENIVQAIARDVMVDRMFAAEREGYPLILTVHDELLAEVDLNNTNLNSKDFGRIMSILPQWADGLPLAAKAWEDERYVK
jgi:DNA polymerase